MEDEEPHSLCWLRGFPSFQGTYQASLNSEDGTVRQVLDFTDKINNNNMADHHQTDESGSLLAKLKQEQDVMKTTFVAFRRWAMDTTKALRTLEARAESAERRAAVNQAEVLRLQELLAKSDRTNARKRKMKCIEREKEDPEEEGSSGDDCREAEKAALTERKLSKCE